MSDREQNDKLLLDILRATVKELEESHSADQERIASLLQANIKLHNEIDNVNSTNLENIMNNFSLYLEKHLLETKMFNLKEEITQKITENNVVKADYDTLLELVQKYINSTKTLMDEVSDDSQFSYPAMDLPCQQEDVKRHHEDPFGTFSKLWHERLLLEQLVQSKSVTVRKIQRTNAYLLGKVLQMEATKKEHFERMKILENESKELKTSHDELRARLYSLDPAMAESLEPTEEPDSSALVYPEEPMPSTSNYQYQICIKQEPKSSSEDNCDSE